MTTTYLTGNKGRWSEDPGVRVLLIYIFLLLVYIPWCALANSDRTALIIAGAVVYHLSCAVAFLLALRNARSEALAKPVRSAWLWVAAAYFCNWIADFFSLYYVHMLKEEPFPSLADPFNLLFYPVMLVGLLRFPLAAGQASERLRFWLDAAVVLIGGWFVVWMLFFQPLTAGLGENLLVTAIGLAYPLGALALLFGAGAVLLGRPPQHCRRPLEITAAGLLLYVVAGLAHGYQTVAGTYEPGSLWEVPYMVAHICFAAGAIIQYLQRHSPVHHTPEKIGGPWTRSLLPYVTIVLAYAVLLISATSKDSTIRADLLIGSGVLTTLVVVRQVLAMEEKRRLLRESQELALQVKQSAARFQSLVQHSSDVMTIVDDQGIIIYQSPAITPIFGYGVQDLVSTTMERWLHPDDRQQGLTFLDQIRAGSRTNRSIQWRLVQSDGTWLQAESTVSRLSDDTGLHGLVLNTRDISERKALEARMEHQAFLDPLTGLANRTLFRQQVEKRLPGGAVGEKRVTILFIDLDGFKSVNDTLGHNAGDRLLALVADRIRSVGCPQDQCARLGGDEFAILLEDGERQIETADQILFHLAEAIDLDGARVRIGASIGIASQAGPEETTDSLLRNADIAMYHAKHAGKGRYSVFKPEMYQRTLERVELESALWSALEREEFILYYQPILGTTTGKVVGVEALARWQRPERELVPPGAFISVAEEIGMMLALGEWILRTACRQAQLWRADGVQPLTLSVNVSARQLLSPGFLPVVKRALQDAGLPPEALILEVTESTVIHCNAEVKERLQGIRELGVRLAIDDFGTGYSSLVYLSALPVDLIKIDRSFVSNVDTDPRNAALTRSIIEMAKALNVATVAEGVERESQRAHLDVLKCDQWQGFHFAQPMPAGEVEALLRADVEGIAQR